MGSLPNKPVNADLTWTNGETVLNSENFTGGINTNIDNVRIALEGTIDALGGPGANPIADISNPPAFSTQATYNVNQIVSYDDLVYRCVTAVETPGAWDSSKWVETILGGGGGGGPVEFVEETTHAALKAKKESGTLVPGKWYRITDYEFWGNNQLYTGLRNGGHQFDILVFATSENTLSDDARACKHAGDTYFTTYNAHLEAWRLKYRFDNSDGFCNFSPTSCKGVIYYLEDEWGNSAGFDFKNLTLNYFYTFDLASSGSHQDASTVMYSKVYNNKIDIFYSSGQVKYGENVFKMTDGLNYCHNNHLSGASTNNTFGKNCYRINLEGSSWRNQFGDENQDMTLRNSSNIDLSGVAKANKMIFDGNNSYLTFAATGTSSDFLQNVHVHFGVQGASGTPKTITLARGLSYETNVVADGTDDLVV